MRSGSESGLGLGLKRHERCFLNMVSRLKTEPEEKEKAANPSAVKALSLVVICSPADYHNAIVGTNKK